VFAHGWCCRIEIHHDGGPFLVGRGAGGEQRQLGVAVGVELEQQHEAVAHIEARTSFVELRWQEADGCHVELPEEREWRLGREWRNALPSLGFAKALRHEVDMEIAHRVMRSELALGDAHVAVEMHDIDLERQLVVLDCRCRGAVRGHERGGRRRYQRG